MKIYPIFIPHLGCPFNCVYCDQETITKSKPPSAQSICKNVSKFCKKNKSEEKEIAFFGGTFTKLSRELQQEYFDAVNEYKDPLTHIRISTRPDSVDQKILDFCKKNNVSTIELGIQSFSDNVLATTGRGYTPQIAIETCNLIQKNKFTLGIQLMPGLPGFNADTLNETIEITITLKPDFVRIYPTIVLKNTKLENWFNEGNYVPLTLEKSIFVTSKMIRKFKEKDISVIKVGLHSDIEAANIIAGPYHHSFGELVRAEMLKNRILSSSHAKTLEISFKDISLFRGFDSKMLKQIKIELGLKELPIRINKNLKKDNFNYSDSEPDENW